jgi:ABC-2 type transport system permease protein
LIAILNIFSWAIGLAISSLIMKYGSRIQVLAWSVVWIIQPFSCVFYPLSSLPLWAQNIAAFFPTTYVFEAMRALMQGFQVQWSSLFIAFILSSILFIIACWLFYYSIQSAKKTGILAKNE